MEHEIILDLLPLYHDGVCSAASRTAVEAHLKSCPDCRAALAAMERRGVRKGIALRPITAPEAVLTGLETRTSSPVRLPRDENGESTDVRGVWPCGEGPGYAGGIMSAAVDGLRAAARVAQNFSPAP